MPKKKPNGEGTIFRRADGRWAGSATLDWQGGKQRRKYVYGRTRREAHGKLTTLLDAQQAGRVIPTGKQTLEQFLNRWLEDVVRPSVRPYTHDSYAQLVRLHISPALGTTRLDKLTPQSVQVLLNQKRKDGLSPRTVQYLRTVLRLALSQALKWDLVSRNVAALTNPPHVPKTEITPFGPGELKTFLKAVEDEPLEALFVVTATAGLRRGEVLGLLWDNVDFKKGQIQVRHAVQRIDGKLRLVETKSARSRLVELTTLAIEALTRHRRRQLEQRLAAGKSWQDFDYVFTNRKGTPLEARTVWRAFKRILAKAGLRDQRFHDLRHAAATLMLSEGVNPKVVAEMLGHSKIAVTMDLYSHVTPTMQVDAVARIDAALGTSRRG